MHNAPPKETGKYTKAEREHFKEMLGPGAAVAFESLRKQAGIRLKITRHEHATGTKFLPIQD